MVACIAEKVNVKLSLLESGSVFALQNPLFHEHIFILPCSNIEVNCRRAEYFLKPLSCLANRYSVRPQNFLLFGGIDYLKPNQV